MVVLSFTVEAVAALGNKVVETLRTQDPSEGNNTVTSKNSDVIDDLLWSQLV